MHLVRIAKIRQRVNPQDFKVLGTEEVLMNSSTIRKIDKTTTGEWRTYLENEEIIYSKAEPYYISEGRLIWPLSGRVRPLDDPSKQ